MAVVMFTSLYTARIVLQVLGVNDYGIYNVVCGFVFMLNVLNTTLTNGAHRYYNVEIGKNNRYGITRIFNTSIRIQLAIALVALLIIESLGAWYIENKMVIPPDRIVAARWVFQFSTIALLLLIIQAPFSSAILSFEKMDFYAFVSIIDVVLKLGIVLIIQIIEYDKLIVYGSLMLMVSLINFLLYFGYCKINIKEIKYVKGFADKQLFKKMLSFSGWLILDPVAYTIRGQGCNMVLNLFFGTIANAAYGISNQVAASLDGFCASISTAFKPQLMQSFSSGDFLRTNRLLYSMSKILFVLKLMLCIPIVFEVDTLLKIWLGNAFPPYAVSFASLTVIVRLIDSLNLPISSVILATEKIKRYMLFTSLTVFCTLPATYILFYLGFDPNSLFIAMIVLTAINQYISVILLEQNCSFFSKKDYSQKVVFPCLIQCFIVFFSSYIVTQLVASPILRLLLVCISSLVFSGLCAYFITFDKEEKVMVNKLVKKFIKKNR